MEYLLSNGATEVKEDHLLDHLSDLNLYTRGAILPSVTDITLLEMQFQVSEEPFPFGNSSVSVTQIAFSLCY